MKTSQKRKGNRYENYISKRLSKWMFCEERVLDRQKTSGAEKDYPYVGDIIPIKNIDWGIFPFFIEVKHGYKDSIPNFNNFSIIKDWLKKALEEVTEEQHIIFLIAKFHNKTNTLFITNQKTNEKEWDLCINVESHCFYVYYLEEIENYNFYNLFIKGNEYLEEQITIR